MVCIANDMIQVGREKAGEALTQLFQTKQAKIFPVYKNRQKNIVTNYRPISSSPFRGTEKVEVAKLRFRRSNALFVLYMELWTSLTRQSTLCFVNLEKAFDPVPRGFLWCRAP